MNAQNKKGSAWALLPIGIFLVIFLGSGIIMGDFYAMPAIVAFLVALLVAFLQNKNNSFDKKIEIITWCKISLRGYEAALILLANGFSNVKVLEGGIATWPYTREK